MRQLIEPIQGESVGSISVRPKTLETLTPQQAMQLARDLYKNYTDMQTARAARETQWRELDTLFGMDAPNKALQSNQGIASDELIRLDRLTEDLAQGVNKPDKVAANKQGVDRVQEVRNTQASQARASNDTYVTNTMMTLFPPGQQYLYVERIDKIEPQQALSLQELLRTHNDLIGIKQEVKKVVKEYSKYGTAVACYEWLKKEQVVWDRGPEQQYSKRRQTVHYAGKLTSIPINQIYFDTTQTDREEAMVIRRKTMTGQEILACSNYKQRKDYEAKALLQLELTPNQVHRENASEGLNLYNIFSAAPQASKSHEVFECWGDFMIDGRVYRNYVAEFTRFDLVKASGSKENTMQVLRFEPNPYGPWKPYVIIQPYEDSASHYPRSPYEHAMAHFKVIAQLQTAAKDIISASACRPTLADISALEPDSVEKLKNEVLHSDMVLFVRADTQRSMSSIFARMEDSQVSQVPAILQLIEIVKRDVKELIGETESQMGGSAPQYMKTGVALAFQQGSQNRLAETVRTVEDQLMLPVARRTLEYFRRYLSQGQTIITARGSIPLGAPIDFDVLANHVSLKGSSYAANSQLMANNLTQTLQMLLGSPVAAMLGDGPMLRLVKELLVWLNIQNVDDIIPQQMIYDKAPPRLSWVDKLRGVFVKNPAVPLPPPPPQQVDPALTPIAA